MRSGCRSYRLVLRLSRSTTSDEQYLKPREAGPCFERLARTQLNKSVRAWLHHNLRLRVLDDEQLVARARRELSDPAGALALVRIRGPIFTAVGEVSAEATEEPAPLDTVPEELDWIEVRVVDEAGQPVANVLYEIQLPGGATRVGKTNALGLLRHERLPPGACKFSLTGLDTKAWELT